MSSINQYIQTDFLETLKVSPAWTEFAEAVASLLPVFETKVGTTSNGAPRQFTIEPAKVIQGTIGVGNTIKYHVDYGAIKITGAGMTFSTDGTLFVNPCDVVGDFYIQFSAVDNLTITVVDFHADDYDFDSVKTIVSDFGIHNKVSDALFRLDKSISSPLLLQKYLRRAGILANIVYYYYTVVSGAKVETTGVNTKLVRAAVYIKPMGNLLLYISKVPIRPLLDYIVVNGSNVQIMAADEQYLSLGALDVTSRRFVSALTDRFLISAATAKFFRSPTGQSYVFAEGTYDLYRTETIVPVSVDSISTLDSMLSLDFKTTDNEAVANEIVRRAVPLRCALGQLISSSLTQKDTFSLAEETAISNAIEDLMNMTDDAAITSVHGDYGNDWNNDYNK